MNPLVSVVIPTYNRSDLVRQAVESVLTQTYSPWECLVIDDGSTDGTAEVLSQMISEVGSDRLRYLPQKNQGVAAARNHGAREARGEFLQFLDSDDLLEPNKLDQGVEALRADPDLDTVYCGAIEFENPDPQRVLAVVHHDPEDFLLLNLRQNICQPATFLWRAQAFERIGPFDERLRGTEDWEHTIRALLSGIHWKRLSGLGVRYRTHSGSRLTNVSEAWGDMRLLTVEVIHEQLQAHGKNHPPYTDALARFLLRVARNLASGGCPRKAREAFGVIAKLKPSPRTLRQIRLFWTLQSIVGPRLAETALRFAHRRLRSRGTLTEQSPWLQRADSGDPPSPRILFYSESPVLGGRERSMTIRALGVAEHDLPVGLICSDRLDLGPFDEAARRLPLGVHPIPLTGRREYRLKAFRPTCDRAQRSRIRRILERMNPEVLVLGQPGPDDCHTALLAANDLGIPVVADVALILDPALLPMKGGALRHWWIRRHYARCRAVVTNCRRNAELLEELGCGPAETFPVIPTGIDVGDFPPCPSPEERARVRRELGLQPDAWVLGSVGRLSIEKGLDWLISAFGTFRRQHPTSELILIGDGPLLPELKEQAKQEGVPVHFLGWRSDVARLFWSLDGFILSSRIEAFPRVVMQAFSARIPVVATNVHGVPDMVRDGETGWLVAPDDTEALTTALLAVQSNPQETARRVEEARQFVETELDQDRQQERFARFLRTLLVKGNS